MLLKDRWSVGSPWHIESLRRFNFALLKGLTIIIRIDPFTNPVVVLRHRNVVSSFVALLVRSLGGKKLHTLRIEIIGQLNCIISGVWEGTKFDNVQCLFPGLAPDLVLILGPLSQLGVTQGAEVSYFPALRQTFRPDVRKRWTGGFESLMEVLMDVPGDMFLLTVEDIKKIQKEANGQDVDSVSTHRTEPGVSILSTLSAQTEDTSIITRSMEQAILTLVPQILKAFRARWIIEWSSGSEDDGSDVECECCRGKYSDEERNDRRSHFEKNRDRLVEWLSRGWAAYLHLNSQQKMMLKMPEECLQEILRGKGVTYECDLECKRHGKSKEDRKGRNGKKR